MRLSLPHRSDRALAVVVAMALSGAGVAQNPQSDSLNASAASSDSPVADAPAPPKNFGLLDLLGLPGRNQSDCPIKIYGWLDQGYSNASTGSGLLAVAPDPNRFGREFLLNQAAVVLDKPIETDRLSVGFYGQFFAGADAAFLQGPGDIVSTNPRFGDTVRQVYGSLHLPFLVEGGIDVMIGRQGTWMGYESYMAPDRPFYSLSYQWNFAEDGADTGAWTIWHFSPNLELRYALTLGSNTFFTLRGGEPCHLFQINYTFDDVEQTKLTATVLIGPKAIGNVIPFTQGTLDTVIELRIVRQWSAQLSQVVQANLGWDQGVPIVGVGRWYGVLLITNFAITPQLDARVRLEWFDDVDGTRTGFATNYYAATAALDFRPVPWVTLRPELRADFAGTSAFGPRNSLHRHADQLSVALECLLRF